MNKPRFVVVDNGHSPVEVDDVFTLVVDKWDDFHFKTSYMLHYTSPEEIIEIGSVKIGSVGMSAYDPHTEIPMRFDALGSDYYSLGQDREYYETLAELPHDIGMVALKALRDVALDSSIFDQMREEVAFETSLLRSVPALTVTNQFRRIATGQAALTEYDVEFSQESRQSLAPTLDLNFRVVPNSWPPTNVHVLIGANGVGKSRLLREFVAAAKSTSETATFKNAGVSASAREDDIPFVNIVHVAYSAFDQEGSGNRETGNGPKVHSVGLVDSDNYRLEQQFALSLKACSRGRRALRWLSAVRLLASADPLLADLSLERLFDEEPAAMEQRAQQEFSGMSSGHKIVVLTVTRLVQLVEERSLVLLDEPETHLHPPLLSALTRAISNLLLDRNGVAIVATHSPVVLQEVPRSCVWVIRRTGNDVRAGRLPSSTETFGESVSRLTSEVFKLDVNMAGYTGMLRQLLRENDGSAEQVFRIMNRQLGSEGQFVLSSLENNAGGDDV